MTLAGFSAGPQRKQARRAGRGVDDSLGIDAVGTGKDQATVTGLSKAVDAPAGRSGWPADRPAEPR